MSLYNPDPREDLLKVELVDGRLVMSIGIDFVARLTTSEINDMSGGAYSDSQVKLTDATTFADAIVGALLYESDDGSTCVHRMLVKAADEAIEGGCEGVEILWNTEAEIDE